MRKLLWPAVAALLVAGCSTAPGHEAGDSPPDPRPLDGALHLSSTDSAALHRAEEREIETCMRERGFAYRTVPDQARHASRAAPYGLLTPEQAARDGYGLTSRRLAGRQQDPNAEHLASLPPAREKEWQIALKGDPDAPRRKQIALQNGPTLSFDPDSCVHLAQRRLYGADWTRRYYVFQHLRNQIVQRTLDRPAVRKAVRSWSACMGEAGLDYAAPGDARAAVHRRVRNAQDDAALRTAGRREMRTARQDARCQGEVRLGTSVARAQQTVENALPESRTSGLAEFARARRAAVTHAAETTAAGDASG